VITGLDELCARRTKGIRHGIEERSDDRPQPPRTGFVGTDFRHAVEFSRSGRAPIEASRPVSGQLAKRYAAGFAVSNPEVPPPHPCRPRCRPWSGGVGPLRLGGGPPAFGAWTTLGGRRGGVKSASRAARTRSGDSSDIRQGRQERVPASRHTVLLSGRTPGPETSDPRAGTGRDVPAPADLPADADHVPIWSRLALTAVSPPLSATTGLMLVTPAGCPPQRPTPDPMLPDQRSR